MATKVFKNKNFKNRNYECTNLVYAVNLGDNQPEGDFWEETNDYKEIDGDIYLGISEVRHIYTSCGIRYFGYV